MISRQIVKHFWLHILCAGVLWPIFNLLQLWAIEFVFSIFLGATAIYVTFNFLVSKNLLNPNNKLSVFVALACGLPLIGTVYILGSLILELICWYEIIESNSCYNQHVDIMVPLILISISLFVSFLLSIPLFRDVAQRGSE